jgi:hypothetical protein
MELRTEFRSEMHSMEGRLKAEIHNMQKWIAATGISMFIGFGGMIFALLNLPRPA